MLKKFNLVELVGAEESIGRLKSATNLLGSTTIKARRIVKPFIEELEDYHTLVKNKIMELVELENDGKKPEGQITYGVKNPTYPEYKKFHTDLLNSEVEIEIRDTNKIDENEFSIDTNTGISGDDIDILIELGIVYDPEEEKADKEGKKEQESDK